MALLRSRLRLIVNEVDDRVKNAVQEAADDIITTIRFTAPIDTGLLRSSFEKRQKDPLNLVVGSEVPYAPYVEYGTYKMRSRPYFLYAFRKGETILKKKTADWLKKIEGIN